MQIANRIKKKKIKEPEPAEEHTEFVSNSRVIVGQAKKRGQKHVKCLHT